MQWSSGIQPEEQGDQDNCFSTRQVGLIFKPFFYVLTKIGLSYVLVNVNLPNVSQHHVS